MTPCATAAANSSDAVGVEQAVARAPGVKQCVFVEKRQKRTSRMQQGVRGGADGPAAKARN